MIGRAVVVVLVLVALAACHTTGNQRSTPVLDFLYPEGSEETPPRDVSLTVPVRVGMAFVPGKRGTPGSLPTADSFSEVRRRELMDRIAAAFEDQETIQSVERIPTSYLELDGGFANLEQLRKAFHVDLMVLLSYDQMQLSEATGWSASYITVVGAFVVEGEENDTHTVVDAVVLDIPSRTLLFRAAGTSRIAEDSTIIDRDHDLLAASERGFDEATGALIEELQEALTAFSEHAATGTVRGLGTPALTVERTVEQPDGSVTRTYGSGALGWVEAAFVLLLLVAGWRRT